MLTLMVRRSFTPSYTAILRWAGTQMLHRRDATYLGGALAPVPDSRRSGIISVKKPPRLGG
jgi:hypothetical protein